YMASIITWFVTGIWHGASWNFIAWGMANCIALLISQELSSWSKRFRKNHPWTSTKAYGAFEVVRTFLIFCMLEMFEYYPFSDVFRLFVSMFLDFRPWQIADGTLFQLGLTGADFAVLLLSVALMVWTGFVSLKTPMRDWVKAKPGWMKFVMVYGLFLSVLIFGVYGQGYDASQFIYNQF
ncbi:MAG: MBOAT family protein, partial [Clostridium sp.]|nr:MBOAT family protein [Clostridium sp.]